MPVTKTAPGNVKAQLSEGIASILSVRLRSLDIEEAIKEAITEHSDEIADLNTEQLRKGEKSDGGTTGTYRNYSYKGRFSPVDLYDTGDFHKSIKPKAFGKAFEMVATDEKTEMLQDRYGDEILGLTDKNITEAGEIITETLIENLRKQL
jgi:hypothetical protein